MAQRHTIHAMKEDRSPQSADKYIVRFPSGMRDQIAEAAKENNRSMNAEIVLRLQESFQQRANGSIDELIKGVVDALMDGHEAELSASGAKLKMTIDLDQDKKD